MAIPRDFINELIARTDIVELIDRKVPLKKAGKNYSACCPFHSEKSPSFTVSRDKQFYHCFGCGAHGNAIDFVMEYDRLDFIDAIEDLAGQLGLEVPREQGTGKRQDDGLSRDLYQLMEEASRFFQTQLRQHQDKQKVIDYLAYRGLSDDIVEHFGIGFAPDGWDGLLSRYRHSQDAQDKLLTAGMLISNDLIVGLGRFGAAHGQKRKYRRGNQRRGHLVACAGGLQRLRGLRCGKGQCCQHGAGQQGGLNRHGRLPHWVRSLRRMLPRPKHSRRLWLWLSGSAPCVRAVSVNHTVPAAFWLLHSRNPSEQLFNQFWVNSRPTLAE